MNFMCLDMLVICMNLYMVVYDIIHHTYVRKRTYCTSVQQKYKRREKKWEIFNEKFKPNLLKVYLI